MKPLAVVAIGGNSLIKDAAHQSVADQYLAVVESMRNLMPLFRNHRIVLTHGNGPQVGFILIRSFLARSVLHEVPLDSCGADTQGALGYQLQQALHNEFVRERLPFTPVTVVTQVVVDQADPEFHNPSKPIGPFYSQEQAADVQARYGWTMREDAGRGWRQVVPSPEPLEILELNAIAHLVNDGYVTIAVGGGGIPVLKRPDGSLEGAIAVIDKDKASSLLATQLQADLFLISTSVEQVYLNFGKPNQMALTDVRLSELRRYEAEGHFKAGSMLPKIVAVRRFLEAGGQHAIITSPELIDDALLGKAGSHFYRD